MPDSKLWLINSDGKIFTLSTKSRHLQHVTTNGQPNGEFKRLSAVSYCTWALGSDHQLYVLVPSSDIPIRVQEATYENERWTPGVGFTGKSILPSARQNWSDGDGVGSLPKDSFELPSSNWEWEGEWQVDENMGGEVSGLGGWQYAFNWLGKFSAESSWRSYVRRRKWVRHRRYISTDKWAQITSLLDEEGEHTIPFLDMSIGGEDLPSQIEGQLYVWTVTITGQVYVREGVSFTCPEGVSWRRIVIDKSGQEDVAVVEISVGSTAQVWVVSVEGEVFLRTNVNTETPHGTDWVRIPQPSGYKILQVSVGKDSVWALTRGGKIWFWKVKSHSEMSQGHWVEMVGEMAFLCVGCNDQVFGIGSSDSSVQIRTSVSQELQTGKTWQTLSILEPRSKEFLASVDSRTSASSSIQSVLRTFPISTSNARISPFNCNKNNNNNNSSGVQPSRSFPVSNSQTSISGLDKKPSSSSLASYHSESSVISEKFRNASEQMYSYECESTQGNNQSSCDKVNNEIVESNSTNTLETPKLCTSDSSDSKSNNNRNLHVSLISQNDNVSKDTSKEEQVDVDKTVIINEDNIKTKVPAQNSTDCVDFVTDLLSSEEKNDIYSQPKDETCNFVTDLLNGSSTYSEQTKCSIKNHFNHDIIDSGQAITKDVNKQVNNDPNNQILNSEGTPKTGQPKNDKPVRDVRPSEALSQGSLKDFDVNDIMSAGEIPDSSEITNINGAFRSSSKYRDSPYETSSLSEFERSGSAVELNLNWIWLSNKACHIEDSSRLPWLQTTSELESAGKPVIDLNLRQTLLERIRSRNSITQKFSQYEEAVEKAVWVKHGQLQLKLQERRRSVWVKCGLELTQGLQENSPQDGLLFLTYQHNTKQMHFQVSLADMVCVCRFSTQDQKPVFGIFLPVDIEAKKKPYILSTESEKEADEWVASITMACNTIKGQGHSLDPAAFWAVTTLGDIFIHQRPQQDQKLTHMSWEQVGGHMLMVKTNLCGITWAISHDHNPYVYSGGFGGGIFKGISGASRDIYPQTDVRTLTIYENQKWHLLTGYSHRYLLANKYAWTDESGKVPMMMESVKPPTNSWTWVGEWVVDFSIPGGVDTDGWQYSSSFPRGVDVRGKSSWRDGYRRRKWIRKCRHVTSGPWVVVGPLPIIDVSVQLVREPQRSIAVWAVGANGDALCRAGVTSDTPQGDSWLHVAADQPFRAISIGGNHWLWVVARDGSAWFRSGITPENPTGKVWLQIVPSPPGGELLQQVSVGENSVWAVDASKKLWRRKNTTAIFPEGTEWELVSKDVRQVSVGLNDQVFAVRDNVTHMKSQVNGVLSRRVGFSPDRPLGTDWEDGIGGIWTEICCGGFPFDGDLSVFRQDSLNKFRDSLQYC